MSVADYSTNPADNTTIGGVFIGEGCSPANINNVIRVMAADIRVMYDDLPDVSALMPRAGGSFTGNPTYQGRGGYLHHNDAANTGGRIFIQAAGGAVPSGMTNGDILMEYWPVAIKVRHQGALRTIQTMWIRVGGKSRRVRSIKVRSGGTLRTVANFAPDLSLNISPSIAMGFGAGNKPELVRSQAVTATPTGGVAPFTYLWVIASGDTSINISNSANATVSFSRVLYGGSAVGTARCTVTDSFGSTAQDTVPITLEHTLV